MKVCSIEDCATEIGKHGARGMCSKHYKRWKANGDPNVVTVAPKGATALESLTFKGWTVTTSGCWEWNGKRDLDGYGTVTRSRRPYRAHRLAYEQWVGSIPDGHVICHRCDNPPCINPDHLFTGTPRDNSHDASGKDRLARDEWHGQCKLSSREVIQLREMYSTGRHTQRGLARSYGISQAQVNNILLNKQRQKAALPCVARSNTHVDAVNS